MGLQALGYRRFGRFRDLRVALGRFGIQEFGLGFGV